jgi:hypothetical protein
MHQKKTEGHYFLTVRWFVFKLHALLLVTKIEQ